ncbi:hypothetical protein CHS0354_035324 [Potamilus streckersoni]|uniref:glycerol kinase n=1 Tax=Potamilus streckersoni TaxID=2493646 RepID=A0AAE0S363_9BIVA|nr:hypothetical protein CHS0354_035324 [Potamilus streckersoni]
MASYVLALDQGTTSSRAILFDRAGMPSVSAQKEFMQIFPSPGRVEHNPEEIWESQLWTIRELFAKRVYNQQMSRRLVSPISGKLRLCGNGIRENRSIMQLCGRTGELPVFCEELKTAGKADIIRGKTGLPIDAYFSGTKVKWILDNIPDARKKAEQGKLCFGTIDSWLLWKLTGGQVHATDISNASRTMLCNIRTGKWDDELCDLFGVSPAMLPEIRSNSEIYGETAVTGSPLPISGIAGDQHAALFGQMCLHSGMIKNTYGTGCFILMNTGETPVTSSNHLLTTVAWRIGGKTTYALEGSVFIGGAVIQWLRDGLGIIKSSAEAEVLARQVNDNGGVYIVPAFTGLGAPYWNPYATGMLTGITRGTTSAHIARAALESIAYQSQDVITAMEADTGNPLTELRTDGGAAVNNLLMQFQSDILGKNVVRPTVTETTALGAAYFAGLAVGFWKNTDEIEGHWQKERIFLPAVTPQKRTELTAGWKHASTGGCYSSESPACGCDSASHVIASDPNDDWQWETELCRSPEWREQLIAEADGHPIGFIQIIDPAREESRYWGDVPLNLRAVDIWIGEPEYLNKGYGTQMMQAGTGRAVLRRRKQKLY